MTKQTRRFKTSLNTEELVGVIVKDSYKLDESLWELLGSFDGNVVYKLKQKKQWQGTNTEQSSNQ